MAGKLTARDEDLLAQFIAGTNHEMEHTDKWYEAASTALDHLRENRRYYSVMKRAFPEEGERDAAAVQLVDRGLRFPNPLASFHSARQEDPSQFVRYGSQYVYHHGPYGEQPILMVYGVPADGGGSRVQSIRFPVEDWTPAAAKSWLAKHGYSVRAFEPAVNE